MTVVTGEQLETAYLLLRLSVAIRTARQRHLFCEQFYMTSL